MTTVITRTTVFDDGSSACEALLTTSRPEVVQELVNFIDQQLHIRVTDTKSLQERRAAASKLTPVEAKRGPKAKQVYITAIEENSHYAETLRVGDVFDSARQASTTLGYGYNALGLAFSNGKQQATLKGVTLGRVEDIKV